MPEGPEHFLQPNLATNKTKHPEVDWDCDHYKISACSRGKEVKVTLSELLMTKAVKSRKLKVLNLVFQFGMSGSFRWSTVDDLPKHAHLRFFAKDSGDKQVLCYHDPRRFGKWRIGDNWSEDRGPDPVHEYDAFRTNVINNISDKIFNRPICETLLNQKYFNGVGNYLRAEILYLAKIAPFERARDVIEALVNVKKDDYDILRACSTVMDQAMTLYDKPGGDYIYIYSGQDSTFSDWVKCYGKKQMKSLVDSNGRTIWFDGKPGPMAPKNSKKTSSKSRGKTKPQNQDVKKTEDKELNDERVTRSRVKKIK
ncbi:nei endonuclease VIII-like 1 [Chamberlinius hualienensis]